MKVAGFIAVISTFLVFVISQGFFRFTLFWTFRTWTIVQVSSLLALIISVHYDQTLRPRFKKLPHSAIVTWALWGIVGFAPLYIFQPEMRTLNSTLLLLPFWVGASGFGIGAFGVVQDRIVAWKQKRDRDTFSA